MDDEKSSTSGPSLNNRYGQILPTGEFVEPPYMKAFRQMSPEALYARHFPPAPTGPNPRRQAAGRLNRQKRKGLTEAGREKLRQSAIRNQPWRHSSGPKTEAGKRRSSYNGRYRQTGKISIRQGKAELRKSAACADELSSLLQKLHHGLTGLGVP